MLFKLGLEEFGPLCKNAFKRWPYNRYMLCLAYHLTNESMFCYNYDRTGSPWWSETTFCWLYSWNSTFFHNCYATSVHKAGSSEEWPTWSQQTKPSLLPPWSPCTFSKFKVWLNVSLLQFARGRGESNFAVNELAEMKNCNKCLLFEGRKNRPDLYLWAANVARGPSAKVRNQASCYVDPQR